MKLRSKMLLACALAATCICMITAGGILATAESGEVEDKLPDFSALDKSELTLKDVAAPNAEASGAGAGVEIYQDEDQNEFVFNSEGDVVGFVKSKKVMEYNEHKAKLFRSGRAKLSDEELEQKARAFMKNAGVKTESYVLTDHTWSEDMEAHILTYYYIAGGYKTSDFAMLFLDESGTVTSFAAPNQGMYEGIELPAIDEANCESRLGDMIAAEYGEDAAFETTNKILVRENDAYYLSCSVSVTQADGTQTGDMLKVPVE